ncbi:ATP-binding protein [Solidesulfovibrio magneticus]|uniref:histidine kinase n=1 Tax=Solidesulfovibrio magneticus (strain ATCC 700980 / DSM 13731 / RS-1) TaxID=573370 RepID=C4XRM9_SOLM1|nr:ATP-binding protein [Solidesulfovibrio magneticus]BAH77945.1 two-component hybrid sensor and regulator [Solidesulfovibrio magneticus RS-1]
MTRAVLWLGLVLAVLALGQPAWAREPAPALPRPALTEAELAYLAARPVLRVGVGQGQIPFQDVVTSPQGHPRYVGLAADYLETLSAMLGVALEPSFGISYARALELAQTGGIDLFACISDTPARRAYLHMTTPYASQPYAMITRAGSDAVWSVPDLAGRVVAVSPSYVAYERLQQEYPALRARFEFKRNAPETLQAVADGQADACFLNVVAATSIIREYGLTNLRITAVMAWPDNALCMASPDPVLAGIIQKALDAIPVDRRIALAARWYDAGPLPAKSYVRPIQLWLAAGAVALVALCVWWWRRLRREVARREATERDLCRHRETLEAVLNATTDAILVLDEAYHVVMVNRTGAERFGLAVEAMLGQGILELTDAPVAASRRQHYRQAQATGRPVRFTDKRAGRVYENTIYPIPALAGDRPRLAIYARDVTEQIAADQAVRQSQERLANIFRLSPVIVTVTTLPDGRLLDVNEAFSAYSGFSREEVIDRTPTELGLWAHPGDRDRIFRAVERDGQVRNLELSMRMRDGRLATFLLSCTPMEAYGRHCLLSVLVDISGRKTMEEALRLAKESAEAANKAKSRFLSTMSHEIRTPMNTILGMVDVLRGTELSGRQQEFLRTLEVAGESLMALLTDILELSKIESGVLELAEAAYDPLELAGQVVALLSPQAQAKGLTLRLEAGKDAPRQAVGDPDRIRQILINLVGNAIKFTAAGEVALKLSLLPARLSREELLFAVSDTGIGIPPEKREAIFKPFTQVDSSTTRAYGGTGLGLAICALLVDGMNGRLWLESEPGAGSVFYCALPRDAGIARPTPAPAPARAVQARPPAGRRLLIVEDSEPNRQIYEAFLEDLPLAVTYAHTGTQALERSERGMYDAIIMDIQLPDIDGLTVIQEIRRREAAAGRPPCPILVVTAFAFREESGRAAEAGASDLLTKPIQKNVFLAAVGRLLGEGSLVTAASSQAWTASDDSGYTGH